MLILLAAVVASLAGFVTLALALLLANRHPGDWRPWLQSFSGGGVLCLGAAGCLLAAGGQYKLVRILQTPAEQSERLARLQLALQEPLEQLLLGIQGVNPFEDPRLATALRLRLRLRSGQEFVSEIPRRLLRVHESEGEDTLYAISWQAVVESATTPEGQALAARFQQVGAFQRVDQLAIDLVQRGSRATPLPDTLLVGVNDRLLPPLFRSDTSGATAVRHLGKRSEREQFAHLSAPLSGSLLGPAVQLALREQQDADTVWVATCDDDHSPTGRIGRFWQWELGPPLNEIGLIFLVFVLGGVLLIVFGMGLLTQSTP